MKASGLLQKTEQRIKGKDAEGRDVTLTLKGASVLSRALKAKNYGNHPESSDRVNRPLPIGGEESQDDLVLSVGVARSTRQQDPPRPVDLECGGVGGGDSDVGSTGDVPVVDAERGDSEVPAVGAGGGGSVGVAVEPEDASRESGSFGGGAVEDGDGPGGHVRSGLSEGDDGEA